MSGRGAEGENVVADCWPLVVQPALILLEVKGQGQVPFPEPAESSGLQKSSPSKPLTARGHTGATRSVSTRGISLNGKISSSQVFRKPLLGC